MARAFVQIQMRLAHEGPPTFPSHLFENKRSSAMLKYRTLGGVTFILEANAPHADNMSRIQLASSSCGQQCIRGSHYLGMGWIQCALLGHLI